MFRDPSAKARATRLNQPDRKPAPANSKFKIQNSKFLTPSAQARATRLNQLDRNPAPTNPKFEIPTFLRPTPKLLNYFGVSSENGNNLPPP